MAAAQINLYENLKRPTVSKTIAVTDWLALIKFSDHSEEITKARSGQLNYEQTKERLLCVTYNFLFDGYKANKNIVSATGLMYIDVDHPDFSMGDFDVAKLYAF